MVSGECVCVTGGVGGGYGECVCLYKGPTYIKAISYYVFNSCVGLVQEASSGILMEMIHR